MKVIILKLVNNVPTVFQEDRLKPEIRARTSGRILKLVSNVPSVFQEDTEGKA